MKRILVLITIFLAVSVCNAQTIDEIIAKYNAANGMEKLEKVKTITIEGKMIQMGSEMPMSLMIKRPDKIRIVISLNDLEIITTYDGEKGLMVNPFAGVTEPVEIPAEQLSGLQEYNMLRNKMAESYKAGRIKLEGEENIGDKPAYKIIISDEEGNNSVTAYIDKESYLTIKTVASVEQMGQVMEVESYMEEYMDVDGIKFVKVINQMVNGMELGGMTIDKIELDKEIDDSLFKIE